MQTATVIAIAVFTLVALAHLLRLLLGIAVTIGGVAVPASASVLACLVAAGLALALYRQARRS